MTCPLADKYSFFKTFLELDDVEELESCKYDYDSCRYYIMCYGSSDPEKCINDIYNSEE